MFSWKILKGVLRWDTHYEYLYEHAKKEADWNKALLFDAWRTMKGQTRGLQRQARLIKRLQRENALLRKSFRTDAT